MCLGLYHCQSLSAQTMGDVVPRATTATLYGHLDKNSIGVRPRASNLFTNAKTASTAGEEPLATPGFVAGAPPLAVSRLRWPCRGLGLIEWHGLIPGTVHDQERWSVYRRSTSGRSGGRRRPLSLGMALAESFAASWLGMPNPGCQGRGCVGVDRVTQFSEDYGDCAR
jgi:hypothetical protein